MFFVVDQWRNVSVKPSQLGRSFEQHVEDILRSEVEGVCSAAFGYTVCVVRILVREHGKIQDGTGLVIVPVKYQAIVCKPFKNEVMDGRVTAVNQLGFFAQCGPVRCFVSRNSMPDYFEFSDGQYADQQSVIKQDCEVRLKLQGVKCEHDGIIAVATINEDYLGPYSDTDGAN